MADRRALAALVVAGAALALGGCASGAGSASATQARVPATPNVYRARPSAQGPRLEGVTGRNRRELEAMFGAPRLVVREGPALKLQFSSERCVLDVYLYAATPQGQARAVHVDARRPTDGGEIDEAFCARILQRK